MHMVKIFKSPWQRTGLLLVVLVKDFLDANKAVVSACRRHLRTTYRGLPQWCSPSNALRQTTKKISSTSPQWGRKSNIVTTSIFFVNKSSISKLQFGTVH